MRFRALVLSTLFAGVSTLSFAQLPSMGENGPMNPGYPGSSPQSGQMGQGGWNNSMRAINSIVGSVHTTNNQPANNVHVELRDGNTGAIIGSSYTTMGGGFEFRQLQQGSYEVIVDSGAAQAQERVQVNSMSTNVDLTLPMTKTPTDGLGSRTVSVNQYRIPEAARAELQKAREAASKRKNEDALKHLDKALEMQPNYSDALALRAAFKLDSRDLPGAIDDAQKAIQSDSNSPLAFTIMGSAMNVEGKFDEALRSLQRAESLAPDMWQTYFELGRAYAGKKDYQMSLQALDRAQRLAPPEYHLIRLVRASSLMGLGRYSEAVSELQGYLSNNPRANTVEQARNMLAQAQAAMGPSSN